MKHRPTFAGQFLALLFLLLATSTVQASLLASDLKHRTTPSPDPKQNKFLQKVQKLSSIEHFNNPNSTAKYSMLKKYISGPSKSSKKSVKDIRKNLEKNHDEGVLESANSTKGNNIIKQSSGVQNLTTLDDIFKARPKKVVPTIRKARGLNNAEVISDEELDNLHLEDTEGEEDMHNTHSSSDDEDNHELFVDEHELMESSEDNTENTEGSEDNEDNEDAVEEEEPEFSIQDLIHVSEMVENIKNMIKAKILGNLQNKMMIKKLEISYEVYEDINQVRKKYHFFKSEIEESITQLKKLVDFLEQFVVDSENDEYLELTLRQKGIEIDEHNHLILLSMTQKLQELVNQLHREIMVTLSDYFNDLDTIHFNEGLDDGEKVRQMLEIASQIAIFENTNLEDLIKNIQEVAKLASDNPHYDHLYKAYEKEFLPPGSEVDENIATQKLSKLSSDTRLNVVSALMLVFSLWSAL